MENGKPTTENRSINNYTPLFGFPLSVVSFALVDVGCPFSIGGCRLSVLQWFCSGGGRGVGQRNVE